MICSAAFGDDPGRGGDGARGGGRVPSGGSGASAGGIPAKLTRPTFYFIGVSTAHSKIMVLFPRWIDALGLPETDIRGFDIEVRGPAERYRTILRHILEERLAVGGLVTTHKIDILKNSGGLLTCLDDYASLFGEVSVLSKRTGRLCGHAKDPISSGLALEAFLPGGYWLANPEARCFIMGAGGSGLALSAYLLREDHGENVPAGIILSNRRPQPLEHARLVHDCMVKRTKVEYVRVTSATTNDRILASLPAGSLVVNATGMGKDLPGSPLTDAALFPEGGYAWDFNYRGSLEFLRQAERRRGRRKLHVEDGWVYFIHGWAQAISEVFGVAIGPREFAALGAVAAPLR